MKNNCDSVISYFKIPLLPDYKHAHIFNVNTFPSLSLATSLPYLHHLSLKLSPFGHKSHCPPSMPTQWWPCIYFTLLLPRLPPPSGKLFQQESVQISLLCQNSKASSIQYISSIPRSPMILHSLLHLSYWIMTKLFAHLFCATDLWSSKARLFLT